MRKIGFKFTTATPKRSTWGFIKQDEFQSVDADGRMEVVLGEPKAELLKADEDGVFTCQNNKFNRNILFKRIKFGKVACFEPEVQNDIIDEFTPKKEKEAEKKKSQTAAARAANPKHKKDEE